MFLTKRLPSVAALAILTTLCQAADSPKEYSAEAPAKSAWPIKPEALAFSPDGKLLAVADARHEVSVIDLSSGGVRQQLKGAKLPIVMIAISSQGVLATAGVVNVRNAAGEGTLFEVLVWEHGTQKARVEMTDPHWRPTEELRAFVTFSADGGLLAFKGKDRNIEIYEVGPWRYKQSVKSRIDPAVAAFAPSNQQIAVGSQEGDFSGFCEVYNLDGSPERHVTHPYSPALDLTWRDELVVAFKDMAYCFDLRKPPAQLDEVKAFWGRPGPMDLRAAVFDISADGTRAAYRAKDRATVLDVRSGRVVWVKDDLAGPLAISADGRRIASGTRSGTTALFSVSGP